MARSSAALVVAALALALALGRVAHADGDEREDAKAEFEAGQRADAQRDYVTAADHYEAANRLVPHPFAMFNIAVDREKLGQLREAVNWYDTYLRAETDTQDRDRIRAHIAELRAKPAPLSIRTMPAGARATIDGRDAGTTPVSARVAGGPHQVVVLLDGQRASRDVTADCGEPIDVQFSLRGQEGTLAITGEPTGALVTVDDVPLGRAPANFVVQPGPHHVVVAETGYTAFDTQVTIRPNDTTPLPFSLARAATPDLTATTGAPGAGTLGWFIGAVSGEDASGKAGFFVEGEIGAFHNAWGGAIRLGSQGGHADFALIARWEPQYRVRPFFAGGYSYVGSDAGVGFGVELTAGLAATVLKLKSVDYVLKAEASVRSYMDKSGSAGGSTSNSYIIPLGVVLEVVMKRTPKPAAATPSYSAPAYQ